MPGMLPSPISQYRLQSRLRRQFALHHDCRNRTSNGENKAKVQIEARASPSRVVWHQGWRYSLQFMAAGAEGTLKCHILSDRVRMDLKCSPTRTLDATDSRRVTGHVSRITPGHSRPSETLARIFLLNILEYGGQKKQAMLWRATSSSDHYSTF